MRKTNMKDVARNAGVSIATVSHVINGTRFVSENTKNRVLQSIKDLNYNIDIAARSLKTGKRYMIAFVVPDIANPFFSSLIEEVEIILSAHNYKLLVVNTKETQKREIDNLKALKNTVDGFIISSTMSSYKELQKILNSETPVVLLDRKFPDAPYDTVISTSYRAMYDGTSHLIKAGHKKIGFITDLTRISTTKERISAYQNAMKQSGLQYEDFLISGDSTSRETHRHIKSLIEMGCTAIILSNHLMAIETFLQIMELGLKPNEDIEILGYEDSEQPQYGLRNMHKICQPTKKLGKIAANRIIERINNNDLPIKEFVLDAELQILSIKKSLLLKPHQF